jgi:hypothetical protein
MKGQVKFCHAIVTHLWPPSCITRLTVIVSHLSATLENISSHCSHTPSVLYTTMDETFSDVSSSSSTSTFDFTKLLDPNESQLLSRSLSLEALPPITDEDLPPFDDVPPFPPPRRLPSSGHHPLKTLRRACLDTPGVTLSIPRTVNMSKKPRIVDTSPVCYMDEHHTWEGMERTEFKQYASEVSLSLGLNQINSPDTTRHWQRLPL